MTVLLGLLALGGFTAFWLWLHVSWSGTPPTDCNDSHAYAAMRAGRPVCRPFRWRLLGTWVPWPRVFELTSLVVAPVLVSAILLQRHVALLPALCGGLLWIGLPGVWGFNARHRGLIDALALALALGVVLAGRTLGGLGLLLLALLTKEVTPIWVALGASDWAALAILPLVAFLMWLTRKPAEIHPLGPLHQKVCENPLFAARKYKSKGQYLSPGLLTPFGLTLLGLGDPLALLAFLIGLGFTLLASDIQRIWQPFCALPLIAATVALVPVEILPCLTALHLVNPWADEGA